MKSRSITHYVVLGVMLATLPACATAPVTKPSLRIVSPANGAVLKSPVKVEVEVAGFNLVSANQMAHTSEGHLHFFVDVPASSVPAGQVVPLDRKDTYIHAGKEPFTVRELALAPGRHTITVVAADSSHVVVTQPEPVSVQVDVQ